MMKEFTKEEDNIQAAILFNEYQDGIGDPCNCGSKNAVLRCEDCFETAPLQCKHCIVKEHVRNPFHHIQEWTGLYFKRTSLHELGARVYLGHSGLPCPNRSSNSNGRPFVIADNNGFHKTVLEFCHCDKGIDQAEALQLVRARLHNYPARICIYLSLIGRLPCPYTLIQEIILLISRCTTEENKCSVSPRCPCKIYFPYSYAHCT